MPNLAYDYRTSMAERLGIVIGCEMHSKVLKLDRDSALRAQGINTNSGFGKGSRIPRTTSFTDYVAEQNTSNNPLLPPVSI